MMKTFFVYLSAISLVMSVSQSLFAQQSEAYVFDKKISLPGDGGYDYVSIDAVNHRLYVSHGSSVNVVDLDTEQPIGEIKDMQGNHGIAIANDLNKGFVSDGRGNSVVVFDLKTLKTIATVHVSGTGPDCITYDPYSRQVFTFCGRSNNASVIDAASLKEVGMVDLGGAPNLPCPMAME